MRRFVAAAKEAEWTRLLATAPVVVTDGGFTEVAPGTVTVLATHPWQPDDAPLP